MMVGRPAGGSGILFFVLKQGSGPGSLTGTDVEVTCNVGRVVSKTGMSVGGRGVGLGLCVGGSGVELGTVEVGTAACVSARVVKAPAIVVSCTSAGSIVGTGCAPQALMAIVMTNTSARIFRWSMVLEVLPIKLTVGKTSSLCYDTFIPDNNFPATLGDAKTAEDSEILLTVDECRCAVLSHGAG